MIFYINKDYGNLSIEAPIFLLKTFKLPITSFHIKDQFTFILNNFNYKNYSKKSLDEIFKEIIENDEYFITFINHICCSVFNLKDKIFFKMIKNKISIFIITDLNNPENFLITNFLIYLIQNTFTNFINNFELIIISSNIETDFLSDLEDIEKLLLNFKIYNKLLKDSTIPIYTIIFEEIELFDEFLEKFFKYNFYKNITFKDKKSIIAKIYNYNEKLNSLKRYYKSYVIYKLYQNINNLSDSKIEKEYFNYLKNCKLNREDFENFILNKVKLNVNFLKNIIENKLKELKPPQLKEVIENNWFKKIFLKKIYERKNKKIYEEERKEYNNLKNKLEKHLTYINDILNKMKKIKDEIKQDDIFNLDLPEPSIIFQEKIFEKIIQNKEFDELIENKFLQGSENWIKLLTNDVEKDSKELWFKYVFPWFDKLIIELFIISSININHKNFFNIKEVEILRKHDFSTKYGFMKEKIYFYKNVFFEKSEDNKENLIFIFTGFFPLEHLIFKEFKGNIYELIKEETFLKNIIKNSFYPYLKLESKEKKELIDEFLEFKNNIDYEVMVKELYKKINDKKYANIRHNLVSLYNTLKILKS